MTSSKTQASSSIPMRKQAKLEASRAKLKYLEETDIIRKEAELDAHLKIRKAQCDIEMCARDVSHGRNS